MKNNYRNLYDKWGKVKKPWSFWKLVWWITGINFLLRLYGLDLPSALVQTAVVFVGLVVIVGIPWKLWKNWRG